MDEQPEADRSVAAGLVGLPKAEALQRLSDLGLAVRLLDWDEAEGPFMVTMEFRSDRVTVQVRDGVVVEAEAG